jgi:hypothetical protein
MPYDVKKSHCRFEKMCPPNAVVVAKQKKRRMMMFGQQLAIVTAVPLQHYSQLFLPIVDYKMLSLQTSAIWNASGFCHAFS